MRAYVKVVGRKKEGFSKSELVVLYPVMELTGVTQREQIQNSDLYTNIETS